jgi:malate/lactate dehydrogenase
MKIGVVGAAGTLGSCAAFAILEKRLPGELWLFDVKRNLLLAHYLDLRIAASVMGQMSVHVAGDFADFAGCDVVVNTAGVAPREVGNRMDLLSDNLRIAQTIASEIGRHCPQAVVINATNPVDPINYAFQLITAMDRKKLIGYSINDTYRLRMNTARKLGVSATRIEALVAGEHGPNQVPLWSTMKLDGKPLPTTPELREWVVAECQNFLREYEVLHSGRTAGWISGVGIAEMVRAVVLDTNEIFPCSVNLSGEYGRRGFSAGVPARIGRKGVQEVVELPLPTDEKDKLAAAFDYLENTARTVRDLLAVPAESLTAVVPH